jgi:hypothetical protein
MTLRIKFKVALDRMGRWPLTALHLEGLLGLSQDQALEHLLAPLHQINWHILDQKARWVQFLLLQWEPQLRRNQDHPGPLQKLTVILQCLWWIGL